MPPGYNLKPLFQGCCVNMEALLYILWSILNKKAILQFQSDAFGEKRGSWGGDKLRSITFDLELELPIFHN